MGTFIVLLVVALIAGLAARSIYKDKKSGNPCAGCGGGCSGACGHSCGTHTQTHKQKIG